MAYSPQEQNDRYKAAFGMAATGTAIALAPIFFAPQASSPEAAFVQALVPAMAGAKLVCPAIATMFNARTKLVDSLARQWLSPIAAGLLFAGMSGGAHIDHHEMQKDVGTWPPALVEPVLAR